MKYTIALILLFNLHLQAQDTTTLRIDITQAKPMNVSEVFDSIHYIKLKFPEGCKNQNILGRVRITKNYFLTYDLSLKILFIFNRQGDFVNKIDRLPKETMNVNDFNSLATFDVDFDSDLIYFGYQEEQTGRNAFYISCLDIHGKEIYKKKGFDNPPLKQYFIQKLAATTFLTSASCALKEINEKPTEPYFQIFNFKEGITNKFLTIGRDPSYKFITEYMSSRGKETYWSKPFLYNAVKFSSKGKPSVLKFMFPAQVCIPDNLPLSDDYLKNFQIAMDYANSNKGVLFEISPVFQIEKWVFFSAGVFSSTGFRSHFLYSQKTGAIVDLKQVKPDKLCKSAPFMSYGIIGVDDQYAYTSIPSVVLNQNATPQSNFVSPNATSVTIGAPSNDNGVYLLQLKIRSDF
ncbi:MAG TPA: 6-bladed beta-propeller [Niabella sp.]|nr:6-bladed beta-propeller [Niabella sp.]HOZ95993.1 6-bladed beta-propeller [Niabella sp.]HQW15512.1 6-bladed beta-propeller [Niabella sp.]HQX20654.1 6-bladed beta-propeller [Niabella sp.]HQX40530.1 6-bladed beta-propeller [Niabella sp.]